MNNNFDSDFERALKFLAGKMPPAKKLIKPTLFHSVRVGIYLYNKEYSKNICIAGLLHDLVEDANVTERDLFNKFGTKISELVMANSKNMNIENNDERLIELIVRCSNHSKEAMIIKSADILDNIYYFTRENKLKEIKKLVKMGILLLEKKEAIFKDKIFDTLQSVITSINIPSAI